MRYTLDKLKGEDWYKRLPGYVKDAVEITPPVLLYKRVYTAGYWMVTGFTEDNQPSPIIQPLERVNKGMINTHSAVVPSQFLSSICWSCKEITPKEELLENDSWCETCNKNSKEKMDNLHTFSEALAHIEDGNLAHREGWPNQVIFMRPEDEIPLEVVIDTIKSLPVSVKQFLDMAHDGERQYADESPIHIGFSRYLCMIDENRDILNGWQPTQQDMLTEDWVLL